MVIDLCSDDEERSERQLDQGRKETETRGKDRALHCPRLDHDENLILNLTQDDESPTPPPHELHQDEDFEPSAPLPPSRPKGRGAETGVPNGNKRKARQISSEEARAVKMAAKVQLQQRHGYYKHQELSLIVEQKLFESDLGGEFGSHLLFASSEKTAYGYLPMQSSISGLCQWTYRSYMDGGHGLSGEVGVTPLPFVAIVFPPQRLIQLALQSPDEGISFPDYSNHLEDLRTQLTSHFLSSSTTSPPQQTTATMNRSMTITKTKVCLLIIGLQEECVLFQRTQRQDSTPTPHLAQRIDELIAFSLYEEDVEIICRKNSSECCLYLDALTRVLGEQLYTTEKSSLDTFKR
jgi:hypothetical protein